MTWKRALLIVLVGIAGALLALGLEALRFIGMPHAAWAAVPEYLRLRWVWCGAWVAVASAATILIAMLITRWGRSPNIFAVGTFICVGGVASTAALALWLNAIETHVQPDLRGGLISLSIGLVLPILAFASCAWLIVSAAVARTQWRRVALTQPDQ